MIAPVNAELLVTFGNGRLGNNRVATHDGAFITRQRRQFGSDFTRLTLDACRLVLETDLYIAHPGTGGDGIVIFRILYRLSRAIKTAHFSQDNASAARHLSERFECLFVCRLMVMSVLCSWCKTWKF